MKSRYCNASCCRPFKAVSLQLPMVSFQVTIKRYVIRRILRRSIRYAYSFLGQSEPFVCLLVSTLVKEMGEAFRTC